MWPTRTANAIRLMREFASRWGVVWALPLRLSAPIEGGDVSSSMSPAGGSGSMATADTVFGELAVDDGIGGLWNDVQFDNVLDQINVMSGLGDDEALKWLFGNETLDTTFDDTL